MTNFRLETSGDSMVSVSRIFFRKVIHNLALDRLIGLRATPKYRAGETKYSGREKRKQNSFNIDGALLKVT